MRTSFMTIIALAATAFAFPTALDQRQALICSSGTQQCCDVNVLGVADLNCETRKSRLFTLDLHKTNIA